MDTGDRFGVIDLLIVFKVMFCTVLGDNGIISGELWDNGRRPYHAPVSLSFHPPQIHGMYMNHRRQVAINYTMLTDDDVRPQLNETDYVGGVDVGVGTNGSRPANASYTYVARIASSDQRIAIPLGHNYGPETNATDDITIMLHVNKSNVFTIEALCVGRTSMVVQVTSLLGPSASGYGDPESSPNASSSIVATLAIIPYRVTVIRKLRLVDFIFDRTITVIAAINSFSIGGLTDVASLRMHFRRPTSVVIAACCQFIIMPIVSLIIAKALGMTPELGVGLFYIACVPGGGMGHVMVSVTHGERVLSMAIHCFTTVAAIAVAPLWIFIMARFLVSSEIDLKLHWFVMWLVVYAATYGLGLLLRHFSPRGMDAYLNWFAKPFLLLYSILFVTLGVYINIYMFSVLDHGVMAGTAVLPLFGYLSGLMVSYISRQESGCMRTIAAETTMSNCFLVLVIIRFSLPQPESDIASALPIWILFMTPVPFLLTAVAKRIQNSIWERCAKRREKKYRNFSIVSSLQNVTNITTLSSSMSPKLASPADENCASLVDEKITVL